jgi:(2R)-3-sulfolactate dehydrogenase (NADP+)
VRAFTLDQVENLAFQALTAHGAAPINAASVARSVRRAEADGIRSVGLGYLPIYLSHLRTGKVAGKAAPAVSVPRPGAVLA